MNKNRILLLAIIGLTTPLMIGCPPDQTICLQILSNRADNFVIKIEDCKTKEAVSISSVVFDRGSEIEPIWLITSDNLEQGGTRFLSTLTYGKLPKQFELKRSPHRLIQGDQLTIRVSDSSYSSIRRGSLKVRVGSD